MSILSKVKSVAKKVVTGVGATLKKAAGAVSSSLGKSNTASVLQGTLLNNTKLGSSKAAPQATGYSGGTTYYNNYDPSGSGQKTSTVQSGQSDFGNDKSGKTIVGMTKYTPSYMTAAPKTVSSGKLSSKSNYSSLSYGTDLAALSASNFMTGGPISTSVSASSLSSQSSPTGVAGTIPSAPSRINYQGTAVGGNVGVGANPENGLIPTSSATSTGTEAEGQAPKEDATSMYQKAMEKLFKQKDSQDELYSKAMDESGIQQARQQMQNTQNSINAITSKMNSDLLQLRGTAAQEGVTEAVYGGQQAQITREATIQLLPLQAQLAADQGNLEMAESNLDTLFKIYSKDAEDSFDFYANQAKTIYDTATKAEQRQLDEITEQKKFEQSLVKDQINAQQSYMSQALKDGNMRLYRALSSIQPPTNINSPSYAQDRQNYIDDVNETVMNYGEVPSSSGTYTPKQLQAITKLNQDVSKNSTYSKTTSMRNYGDNVIASLQLGSGVGDISAINQFQKVIDEGAVTRDQDVKLIQGSQSLANTLKTKIKKLEKGEQLSPQLRAEMRTAVEAMYNKQVEALQKDPYISAKTREAELYGITAADTILGELGAFTQNQNTTGDGATKVYNGVTYKVINGVWTPQ